MTGGAVEQVSAIARCQTIGLETKLSTKRSAERTSGAIKAMMAERAAERMSLPLMPSTAGSGVSRSGALVMRSAAKADD